jgi:hypothetical protein
MLPAHDAPNQNAMNCQPSRIPTAITRGKHVWHPSLTSLAMPVKVTEITKESDSGYLFGRSGVRLDASTRSSEFKFASAVDPSDSFPTR